MGFYIFFYFPYGLHHISGPTGLTKVVHLSKFAEFCKENSYENSFEITFKMKIHSYFKKQKKINLYVLHVINHHKMGNISSFLFIFCRPTDSTFQGNKKNFGQSNFLLFLIYRPTDSPKMARHKSAILKINRTWPEFQSVHNNSMCRVKTFEVLCSCKKIFKDLSTLFCTVAIPDLTGCYGV